MPPAWAELGLRPGSALVEEAPSKETTAGWQLPDGRTGTVTLVAGEIHEIVVRAPSAGGQLVIETLLRQRRRKQEYGVLIDCGDHLNPSDYPVALLESLFWIRGISFRKALVAADLVLRDDTFGFLAVDTRIGNRPILRSVPLSSWYRLQGLARQRGGYCVIVTTEPGVPCAHTRIELDQPHTLADLERERVALLENLSLRQTKSRSHSVALTHVA